MSKRRMCDVCADAQNKFLVCGACHGEACASCYKTWFDSNLNLPACMQTGCRRAFTRADLKAVFTSKQVQVGFTHAGQPCRLLMWQA